MYPPISLAQDTFAGLTSPGRATSGATRELRLAGVLPLSAAGYATGQTVVPMAKEVKVAAERTAISAN